ncbi:MAG TPA: DUF1972 domain-containing protein [Chitinophagaceae bacterium]
MKIGIIGTRGIPNQYGGFEQFAQQLSTALAERGHDLYVYNSSHHPYQQDKFEKVNIIHCRDWEDKIGTAGQFIYDLNCINDARKRDFDVLLHLGYTSDSVWHWRWPKNTRHIVNMDGLEWKRSKYNKLTRRFLKWAEALAGKHADILIADSPAIQDYLAGKFSKKIVHIPYIASICEHPDVALLNHFTVAPYSYFLVIARMEPENNIETIIKGFLLSKQSYPLLIIGNTSNKHGSYLSKNYSSGKVRFAGPIYETETLNSLRYYSKTYFHGHSVGGTNPSLLEAMACQCSIIAHENVFNRAVLADDAGYFSNEAGIVQLIKSSSNTDRIAQQKKANLEKISKLYNAKKIVGDYEALMLRSVSSSR